MKLKLWVNKKSPPEMIIQADADGKTGPDGM
uniref:Uncharacterized protein n=1 Tax=Levilinea saccharolytica TaxID=229921 RepID=A0A0M9U309_9CHLR|nr:hypothetical protein LSAC_03184 [Levilinea saccharolytica]